MHGLVIFSSALTGTFKKSVECSLPKFGKYLEHLEVIAKILHYFGLTLELF
jgi:hypothetical protein